MQAQPTSLPAHRNWPSARQFTEAIQCPAVCFAEPELKGTLPAVDRLGMPLVTSGQFAFVYKLKALNSSDEFAVRCFRGYLRDRDQRYRAIQRHLKAHPVSFLSDLTYSPEGILVSGHRFPILSMQWIDGPTLDLYIEQMLLRREVLVHLGQEWLKLVAALRSAEIAHGDLQHGNIIVEKGGLRLVDHDGLFVPEMKNWRSSEVGHQHYQHPRRDAHHFDANLDNFSVLAIYLTLISLVERPELWQQHHDENLLFTKADYLDPANSLLFAKIKELGPEQRHLAETLETAAVNAPESVPYLLDLVSIKSTLPQWMSEIDLEAEVKTRESKVQLPNTREHPRWIPKSTSARYAPASPNSNTVQTLFGAAAPSPAPFGLPGITDPKAIWSNTPKFAKHMLTRTFLWWYWGMYIFLKIFGLDLVPALLFGFISVFMVCLIAGFIRAQQIARRAYISATPKQAISSTASQVGAPLHTQTPRRAPAGITTNDPLIGNTALNIYHLTDCEWVRQIVSKNRVTFASSSEASSAGYKACRVCSPAS